MSMGAALYRTGKINGSDPGRLYESMPWTCSFCIVGASSISALPLFSGFISTSMVMQAAADEGHLAIWPRLLFATAGVFYHAVRSSSSPSCPTIPGYAAKRGSAQYAVGHGYRREFMYRHRLIPAISLQHLTLSSRLRTLHDNPYFLASTASVVLRAGLCHTQTDKPLPTRVVLTQHWRGLYLSEVIAGNSTMVCSNCCAATRQLYRLGQTTSFPHCQPNSQAPRAVRNFCAYLAK